jgi:hypothetical protein
MPHISMDKVKEVDLTAKPVYKDLQRRLETIRKRAFELFEKRGHEPGAKLRIGSRRSGRCSAGRRSEHKGPIENSNYRCPSTTATSTRWKFW